MSANEGHPPSFQLFPRDYLSSIEQESEDFKARYLLALARSWDERNYGVGYEIDWLRWMGASGCSPDAQRSLSDAVRRHTNAQPDGALVQMRMVHDRNEQRDRHIQAVRAGQERQRKRKSRNTDKRPLSTAQRAVPTADPLPLPIASASALPSASTKPQGDTPTRAAPAFVRPSLAEVSAYCAEREAAGHRHVDPQAWLDHYASNGWRVGRNPMRDWKAAVRTWERSGFENGNGQPTGDAAVSAWLKRQEAGRA